MKQTVSVMVSAAVIFLALILPCPAAAQTMSVPQTTTTPILQVQPPPVNPAVISPNLPPQGTITISLPRADEVWYTGSYQRVEWICSGTRSNSVDVGLWKDGKLAVSIGTRVTTGRTAYKIPVNFPAGRYELRVTSSDDPRVGALKNETIVPATLTITAPRKDALLATGSTYPIFWQYKGDSGPIKIELLTADGGAPLLIATNVPLGGAGTGQYNWQVFENLGPADNFLIRITSLASGAVTSATGPFRVVRPSIQLASPRAGDVFSPGSYIPIKWNYIGNNFGTQVRVTATPSGSTSPALDVNNLPMGSNGQGGYQWKPPELPQSQTYTIRVESVQNRSISAQLQDGIKVTGMTAGQTPAAASFNVSPASAKPYYDVSFSYRFQAPEPGTYFMHALRKDQPDNQSGICYKDLTAERRDGWIEGRFSCRLPIDPSLSGRYSFRIFGPLRECTKSNAWGAQKICTVRMTKLFDEGVFDFGPYATQLGVPATIQPKRTMQIKWSDVSVHPAAWIGIFKRENSNEYPIIRKSFVNLPGGVWEVEAPAQVGNYDVRAFIDQGFQTTSIRPFQVTWGTLNPVLGGYPASCYPNVSLVVSYANGPPEINAIVGIFDAANPSVTSPRSSRSLQGKTSGEFVFSAPPYPGQYDVRMVDSAGNILHRGPPFQVVSASSTIKLIARSDSGRVILNWNNPANYQRLANYYLFRGTSPGQATTPLTAGPMPVDTTAAASTVMNGFIDTAVERGKTYYYVVRPDLTFGPPSNEAVVQVEP